MRLFEVAKVGCFCDAVAHSIETRRDSEVKILKLTLRVSPFDAKLASAMPDGVRTTLFKTNVPEPKPNLSRVTFSGLCDTRQVLQVFAAPDTTKASFALDQVKITGTYARTQKDRNGFDFVFAASFGPAGRDELEQVQAWLLTQRFVTFQVAEPGMFDEDANGDEGDIADTDEQARQPRPMWADGDEQNPSRAATEAEEPAEPAKQEPVRQRTHSHAAGKTRASKMDRKLARPDKPRTRSLRRGRR